MHVCFTCDISIQETACTITQGLFCTCFAAEGWTVTQAAYPLCPLLCNTYVWNQPLQCRKSWQTLLQGHPENLQNFGTSSWHFCMYNSPASWNALITYIASSAIQSWSCIVCNSSMNICWGLRKYIQKE